MPKFTHFGIWDNEVEALLARMEKNPLLNDLVDDAKDWLFEEGPLYYCDFELKKYLQKDAADSIQKNNRFADISPAGMAGYAMYAFDDLKKLFMEFFSDIVYKPKLDALSYEYDRFVLEAIRNHKPFLAVRAEISSNIPLTILIPDSKSKGNEKRDLAGLTPQKNSPSPITKYLIDKMTDYKATLRTSSTDENAQLESDLSTFILLRREYEVFTTKSVLTPRTLRSPALAKDSNALSVAMTSRPTITDSPAPPFNPSSKQRLMGSLSKLSLIANKNDRKEPESSPSVSFDLGTKPAKRS